MGKLGKKLKKFFVGEKAHKPVEVQARGEDAGEQRKESKGKAETARKDAVKRRDKLGEQQGKATEISETSQGDVDASTQSFEQQRQLTAALQGALGETQNLASLQAAQAQQQQRSAFGAQVAAGGGPGGLAAALQGQLGAGQDLAQQAGQAVGQEDIQRQQQLGGLGAQQAQADLGQQGLGQSLALGGAQGALQGQGALLGAAQSREDLQRSALFERQKQQFMSDLRIRQAAFNQPQSGGLLPGMFAGGGALVGGLVGGGPAGAKLGGSLGEGLGTAVSAGAR